VTIINQYKDGTPDFTHVGKYVERYDVGGQNFLDVTTPAVNGSLSADKNGNIHLG
jgi:hypothetical protein